MTHDIYSLDAIEVIVRITQEDALLFHNNNGISIKEINSELSDKELECHFQRLAPEEHKVIVPFRNGQLELVVKIHTSETYQAIVNNKLKTQFRAEQKLPEKDFLKETVYIRIIDINERARATNEFSELSKRVENLNQVSEIDIDSQKEIWLKWIEAQKAIVDNLQKPFSVKTDFDLKEHWNDKRELVRYTLQFNLANEIMPEYTQLEAKVRELGINESFDSDGSVLLTRDEIKLLDAVLQREFSETIERSPLIGAILKLQPMSPARKIAAEIGLEIVNHYNQQIWIKGIARKEINRQMRERGFEFKAYAADFEIINHGNILDNEGLNQQFGLRFGRTISSHSSDKEYLLPFPDGNTFSVRSDFLQPVRMIDDVNTSLVENEYFKLQLFYRSLVRIYGKGNIVVKDQTVYEAVENEIINTPATGFSEEFWIELRRKLYIHNLEETLYPLKQALFIEFTSEDELKNQLSVIQGLNACSIAYSPLQDDFRFKIKTNVIKKKTEKELFLEKLKLLRGAEFVVDLEGDKIQQQIVYVGKLNAAESDLKKLSLDIPNIFPDDKRKAREALKFLQKETRPVINSIRANLTGDAAKITWLLKAVNKITSSNSAPNGKPVNEKLGEFLFDTNKASPVYDPSKVTENSEYYWDVKNNELLSLNESQRKAVLAAIHCTDLALLQGPPGTGKTTVISEIIWQIIRKNPAHKILLTSETNLAVDNALDRLLNVKGVNAELARYTTLIKPVRFGRISKMDEEGAKYSYDRIMRWIDEQYEMSESEETASLDEQDDYDSETAENNSPENNAVQDWMKRIASRALNTEPKYANALKDWALDLSFPSREVKKLFADKYFKHANIVGSTCSSSGSPRFMWDAAKVLSDKDFSQLKKLNATLLRAPFANLLAERLRNFPIPDVLLEEFGLLLKQYQDDYKVIQNYFKPDYYSGDKGLQIRFSTLKKINDTPIKSTNDSRNLVSFQKLVEFSSRNLAPYAEPELAFDTVIMDEASKATPPEMLLPLCFGKRCIIIGDHRQLPPMLNEKDFAELLMESGIPELADQIDKEYTETSQFERMIMNPKISPTIISRCNVQYRMHPDINEVIKQFYIDEGGLEPASELIKSADSADLNDLFSRHHGIHIPGIIDPGQHVLWVNVDHPELREGTSFTNQGEVKAIRQIIEEIKSTDGFGKFQNHWNIIKDEFKRMQELEIGVISFYGAQKRLLRRRLAGLGLPLKINTVDRFQGMERNIIIVSTVRSNRQQIFGGRYKANSDCGFAKSPQRLNVALSRARRLLIVVGNSDFFSGVKDRHGRFLYKNAIDVIKQKGRIVDFEKVNGIL